MKNLNICATHAGLQKDDDSGFYVTPCASKIHGFRVSTREYNRFTVVCPDDDIHFSIYSDSGELCKNKKDSFTYYLSPDEWIQPDFNIIILLSRKSKICILFERWD